MALARSSLHQFVSGIADSGDATLLQPSNWNATHTLAITGAVSGGIPYFDSTTTEATSALLAANALMIGGGAGTAPATTTTGTGVVTALGVAVGSAGAVVTNGGALGTPSSGTLTNCTGLPVAGVTGALGYSMQFATTIGNPADATTYFIGMIATLTATTATGLLRIVIPKAGTVKRIDVHVGVGGTLGTTEASTFNFRLNNTTDTQITASALASAIGQDYSAAVSIAVVAGDYFEIKMTTPTWVTNPTNVLVNGSIYIE